VTLSTAGGELVTVSGSWFGPLGTAVSASYGAFGSANVYNASACSVSVAHVEIVCTSVAGVGRNLSWTVTVGGQTSVGFAAVAYVAPVLSSVTASSPVPTSGIAELVIRGTGLGPAAPRVPSTVLYFAAAYPSVLYSAQSCSGNHTVMTCTFAPGVGSNLVFRVTVGGQSSGNASTSISYAGPVVSSLFCADASTAGGTSLTITVPICLGSVRSLKARAGIVLRALDYADEPDRCLNRAHGKRGRPGCMCSLAQRHGAALLAADGRRCGPPYVLVDRR
jgi:hypothetical protein